ncbi:CAP domain-containing protein [Novosphingobium sp.]|uniref:CAP domain-containing protein n=1 Tax=Novosphingobium sp. TaxID=1874826 RepID=UPI0026204F9F|nr:CAP domain-containing protein [Novosphingobium sp.]
MLREIGCAALAFWLSMNAVPVAAQYPVDQDGVAIEEEMETAKTSVAPLFDESEAQFAADRWRSAQTASLYAEQPDPGHCSAGVLRPEAALAFVRALNALRALHGLAPVRYNVAAEREAGAAALMMAANNALSHDPPPSWTCWTATGAAAAGSSNLLMGVSSAYSALENDNAILAEWLIEGNGDEIGHRRWLLDPYLEQTALGRFTAVLHGGVRVDSVVMKVFDFPSEPPNQAEAAVPIPDFVGWPQGDYPSVFFSPSARLSFSVSQNPVEGDTPAQVDFSQAKVSISDGERIVPVRDKLWDNEGYGVANCLSWRMDGIYPNRMYSVEISGLRGAPLDRYRYSFRIVR